MQLEVGFCEEGTGVEEAEEAFVSLLGAKKDGGAVGLVVLEDELGEEVIDEEVSDAS